MGWWIIYVPLSRCSPEAGGGVIPAAFQQNCRPAWWERGSLNRAQRQQQEKFPWKGLVSVKPFPKGLLLHHAVVARSKRLLHLAEHSSSISVGWEDPESNPVGARKKSFCDFNRTRQALESSPTCNRRCSLKKKKSMNVFSKPCHKTWDCSVSPRGAPEIENTLCAFIAPFCGT